MISLANDLLRKSNGHIHTMPLSINHKPEPVMQSKTKRKPPAKYVDENGKPEFRSVIAKRFGVSPTKVAHLFGKYPADEVYRLINTDIRQRNGQRGVYSLPCGKEETSAGVGEYYGVNRSTVQRAWFVADKDAAKAHLSLATRFKPEDLIQKH